MVDGTERMGGSEQGEASMTATAELSTVDRIVNFAVKYLSFIIVSCATFYEDDQAGQH